MIRVKLFSPEQGHSALRQAWAAIRPLLLSDRYLWLEIKEDTRSLPQNRRMWAMLADVGQQVDWHGNRLTAEEWKDVFTASLKGQKVVPGIDSGFVVLGTRTSRMSRAELGELMELIAAFGAQRDVTFSDPLDTSHHLTATGAA